MHIGIGYINRGLGGGGIDVLAQAIQSVEGYSGPSLLYPKGTRAFNNNNPGNLMYAGQAGATGKDDKGFAIFPSYDVGYAALLQQIRYQATPGYRSPATGQVYPLGQNLEQFINTYAPPSQNNTSAYLSRLETDTGYSRSDLLSTIIAGGASGLDATDSTTVTDLKSQNADGISSSSDQSPDGTDSNTTLMIVGGVGIVALLFLLSR